MNINMNRVALLLEAWGKWVSASRPGGRNHLISGAYQKRGIACTTPDDDDIPLLVDRAIAAMPKSMIPIQIALKNRYVWKHSNYTGARFMETSESYYRDLLRQGSTWVWGYMVSECRRLKNHDLYAWLIEDDTDRLAPPPPITAGYDA